MVALGVLNERVHQVAERFWLRLEKRPSALESRAPTVGVPTGRTSASVAGAHVVRALRTGGYMKVAGQVTDSERRVAGLFTSGG